MRPRQVGVCFIGFVLFTWFLYFFRLPCLLQCFCPPLCFVRWLDVWLALVCSAWSDCLFVCLLACLTHSGLDLVLGQFGFRVSSPVLGRPSARAWLAWQSIVEYSTLGPGPGSYSIASTFAPRAQMPTHRRTFPGGFGVSDSFPSSGREALLDGCLGYPKVVVFSGRKVRERGREGEE